MRGKFIGRRTVGKGWHHRCRGICLWDRKHTTFRVESDKYEGAVQELKDKGVEIILGDERATGAVVNGRSVYFPDPDGNVLELVDMYSYSGAVDAPDT